ncbi:MAG: hypothetical protein ACO1SV_21450 [Fimbriimonas sp.]
MAQRDPIFDDSPNGDCDSSEVLMNASFSASTTRITRAIGPDSQVSVANDAGSGSALVVEWYTAAGRQSATIAPDSSKVVVPFDGYVVLYTEAGTATGSLTASKLCSGTIASSPSVTEAARPVSLSDGGSVTLGAKADAAAGSDTGGFSVVALLKRGLQSLTSLIATINDGIGLNASEIHIGQVGWHGSTPSVVLTRQANVTPYALGQTMTTAATGAASAPLAVTVSRVAGRTVLIPRMRVKRSSSNTGVLRVHVHSQQPALANGDGGVWSPNLAHYGGSFDVVFDTSTIGTDGGWGVGTPRNGPFIEITPLATEIFLTTEWRTSTNVQSGETFEFIPEVLQS